MNHFMNSFFKLLLFSAEVSAAPALPSFFYSYISLELCQIELGLIFFPFFLYAVAFFFLTSVFPKTQKRREKKTIYCFCNVHLFCCTVQNKQKWNVYTFWPPHAPKRKLKKQTVCLTSSVGGYFFLLSWGKKEGQHPYFSPFPSSNFVVRNKKYKFSQIDSCTTLLWR